MPNNNRFERVHIKHLKITDIFRITSWNQQFMGME